LDAFSGQTPTFEIAQISNQDIAIEMLKLMRSKDADLGFKDKLRQNIIFYIARDGKVKLLEYLVSEGVGVAEVDTHGQIPLFYAAREGHTETCRSLIANGTDVNHADVVKQTCLFYSAKSGHLDTCKALIELGAKHTHTDKKKQTALFWAKKSENPQLIEYFESLKNQKPTVAAPVIAKERTVSESKSNKKKKTREDQNTHIIWCIPMKAATRFK